MSCHAIAGSVGSTYCEDCRFVPPQNIIVAVQLLAGVRGNIAVPALAGYVLTASGILSKGVSWPLLGSKVMVAQFACIKSFPEGRSQVSGYRLVGKVVLRKFELTGPPWEGKNS
jgi:hypothetical protein